VIIYPFMRETAEKWFKANPEKGLGVVRDHIDDSDVILYYRCYHRRSPITCRTKT